MFATGDLGLLFRRGVIEVSHDRCAVMLLDEGKKRAGQLVLLGHLHAVFDVGHDDQQAHGRREVLVTVDRRLLVFDEVLSLLDLADVVVKRADRG